MKMSWPKFGVWFAVLLALCVAAVVDGRGWRRYLKLSHDVADLQRKNALAAQENQRLAREAHALKENPAAVERAIREELGFIHPGELMLQLRPNVAHPAPPPAAH